MIEERLSSKEMAGLEADFTKMANVEKLIAKCELEIEFPYREFTDENVGGSRSTLRHDKIQEILEKKEQNTYLQRLYWLEKIKKKLLSKMSKDQKKYTICGTALILISTGYR
ncbi:hypothetical protein [Liquorilactobacillus satsumensis]|uniref:hypothetical protein n=1 Tax=Liquorilactobacillus satsumensis TaxID=259059 RepID=UPI001E319E92|nr:hypothetical protein [Liquorilactobacillus satsumensis]MCC7667447.1 hypothetical protein [Liquorilactobacillus satsumensis]